MLVSICIATVAKISDAVTMPTTSLLLCINNLPSIDTSTSPTAYANELGLSGHGQFFMVPLFCFVNIRHKYFDVVLTK